MKTKLSAMIGTASLIALSTPAMAQDASATPAAASNAAQGGTDMTEQQAGDIVVTAQRRQERVVDVPISITVASQAQLERQQVNTVNDLSRISPSLEVQQAPGQNTGGGGSLRGLGTQTFSAGAVASVGIVVDQVSQGNANISDLFDVGRIEVLKGPQGTLFGLTTSAGVINITTNAPDPSGFSARVRTELSDAGTAGSQYGNQIVQGVVNVPITTDAALRVSGFGNLRQGPNRNATGDTLNDTNRYGGRARLLWRPGDRLTFNLIGDYSKTKTENGGDFFTFVSTGGPGLIFGAVPDTRGITARLASCGVTAREGNRDYCTSQSYTGRFKSYGGSFQADYEAEPFTLTSITAYREARETGLGSATNVFRADPLELQVANGPVNRRISLFTQEFRISSPASQFLEYTAGTFFSRQIQNRDPESLSVSIVPAPGVVIPVARNLGAFDRILDESLSVFGQGTIHLTSKARLIAGGRYTSAKLALNRTSLDTPASPFYRQELSTGKISYRFGAQYDLANRTMVYATASRGFKGGQIATPALPAVPYVVQPEIPTAYEAGLKTTLFGGWVADLNVFYTKIKDFQAQSCTTDPATAAISCVQNNIDGVKSRGAEINLFGRVTRDLSINTGFILAKATYPGSYIGTDGTNIGGTQLAYAPKYKFTFSGEYEHLVANGFKGFLAGDTVWKSRIRYEANSLAETTYRAHWTVGGRLGVRTEDDRYQVAVFARNLFNQHEPQLMQSSFPYGGATNVGAIYGPQSFRQIGLSLDAKF
ncbi:TonB-dependent receptor [Sphingomonas sp. BIUV-7]|uniref:TonB-dependent receptor n=1 Tax=Sphingomonas natans TaxID=3063330 RepID=A0ABT8Y8E2_9SPHN|nr:TonB-dependent receptor [Sphingomonas sp. BIUV-7]MDO6414148.1 TonB-dependent receptor [Sphingomonas sp. BIUV-7]